MKIVALSRPDQQVVLWLQSLRSWLAHQTAFIMRVSLVLLTTAFCLTASAGVSQLVSINARHASVEEIIDVVQKQTGYVFFYKEKVLKDAKRITVNVRDMPIQTFLELVFKDQPFDWSFENQTVVLELKPTTRLLSAGILASIDTIPKFISVYGVVTNPNGEPVPYASVSVRGKASGITTGRDGSFSIKAMINDVIVITSVGYAPHEHRVRTPARIRIELSLTTASMKEVVTIGIMTRKAESFTGSAVTVTKEELLRAGSQNVLQSLKNIDPTFRLVENLELGSDPNQLPEIVMRGRSSLPDLTGTYSGNPNQPLFILDGFETTLQRVYDLDMNRIRTITLLKDAAAKAVYGAKAGNGVVVIETLQPLRGKLRLSYSSNISVDAPDLTGYNLMNAKEKLQFEVERGMFEAAWDPNLATYRESQYNQLYQDAYVKGVNTHWLSKPLQTGIGQRHSVMMEGGDDFLRYGATFYYNKLTGAMKGSNRVTMSGNTTLSYRYKNLLFRNTLDVSQNDANNSPYGSFSEYAELNAYWTPYDDNGNPKKMLGFYPNSLLPATGWDITYNPLYNASLNVINSSSYQQVIDNFYVEWNAAKNLRLKGSIGYTSQRNSADDFRPPGHTDFIGYTEENGLINYKGKWTKQSGISRTMESNIGADYNLYIRKHSFFSNVTLNVSDSRSNSNSFVAEGFGSDNVTDISMANYYQRGGAPTGTDSRTRSIGVVGAVNYTYDNRFLFDASYRTQASSIYGKNARWGSFWSLGTGWNLHNEQFIRDLRIFQQLRIRGSMGYTGAQNADSYLTLATYKYVSTVYDGIKGATLMALPNPDLRWQKILDYNAGVDISMLNNRLSIRFEMYKRITTNLLQDISAAPSMGFSTFRANIGKTLNTGEELSIRYQVYNDNKNRAYINVSVTGTRNRNRLTDIADAFRSYNEKEDAKVTSGNVLFRKPVARFYEGQSMTAIWAMRSLGIDPSTGSELFLNREGKMTYNWTSNELIIAGDTEPKVNGTFGLNMGYKGFSLSLICSFRFGGQLYNATLVERVENINGRLNLDRRINNAWKKTGDVAIYKEPQVSAAVHSINFTKPTTRFVQDNDEVFFSTINLGYDVQSRKLLQKLGMDRLRVTFYTNELARISSITTERGTSYPFARNFSFSLQTTF